MDSRVWALDSGGIAGSRDCGGPEHGKHQKELGVGWDHQGRSKNIHSLFSHTKCLFVCFVCVFCFLVFFVFCLKNSLPAMFLIVWRECELRRREHFGWWLPIEIEKVDGFKDNFEGGTNRTWQIWTRDGKGEGSVTSAVWGLVFIRWVAVPHFGVGNWKKPFRGSRFAHGIGRGWE